MVKWLASIFFLAGIILGWWWLGHRQVDVETTEDISRSEEQRPIPPLERETVIPETPVVEEPVVPVAPPKRSVKNVQYVVPFTSQAPTGDWSRSEFQDGCEEASVFMVMLWREGIKSVTREEARGAMVTLAEFQRERIGHGVDTDVADTARLLLDEKYGIRDYRLDYDFTLEELQLALEDGLIIVPTNGRALGNPNFTRPGPLQHMLVITGYDREAKEFITNDPGTRKGEGYRYPEQILYDAIREYPTGKHLPMVTERKAMIVVPPAPGS